ncbi:MAG: PAS domain S-box protein [Lentimicrobium sp.]|nr:PAS domain S-box protein [Lentimicrobium sp.]
MSKNKPDREELQKELEDLKIAYKELSLTLSDEIIRHKETEDALRMSEQKSRALIEAIPDLMFRINKRGIYLDYKAAKEELYYQSETIVGKNNRDITPPDFADLIEKKINKTLQTGKVQVFEYSLNIDHKPIASDYEAWMVPSGPEEVTAIVRNITERKITERILIEREINARAIIDASSDILCLIDKGGILIDCNQTFGSYLGHKPEELAGKCILSYLQEKDTDNYREHIEQIFSSGQRMSGKTEITVYDCRGKNGKWQVLHTKFVG